MDRVTAARYAAVIGVLALAFGVTAAELASWTCDDAFISIRYARNLVAGDGLVFNPGEHVEGYTNPAWTVLLALGLALGIAAEPFAVQLGVLAYAIALVVLAVEHRRRLALDTGATMVPVAAIVGALHFDWAIHATSGLETSMLATTVLLGFVALGRDLERVHPRGWPGAMWLGLAALVRPDAALFAAAGALPYLVLSRRGALLRYVGMVLAWVVPAMLARWSYYGTLLPNTYAAKSAGTPWWDQGLAYLGLYLQQYAALFIGIPIALVCAWQQRNRAPVAPRLVLAMVLAIVMYATAVVRVGGDFMFARLFVPLTPLAALLLERGLAMAWPKRTAVHALVTVVVVLAMQLSPRPVDADRWPHGVADEWAFYDADAVAESERDAAVLGRVIEGVPVRIAFLGGMARVVDGARVPWAVDAETGLTDAGIASKTLARRGRPGHEKRATVDELLERRVHFVIGRSAAKVLQLDRALPLVPVRLGTLEGFVIHWDPEVFAQLRARGLRIPDYPAYLDRVIASLPTLDDAQAQDAFDRAQRFYFDGVDDPERHAAFDARARERAQ